MSNPDIVGSSSSGGSSSHSNNRHNHSRIRPNNVSSSSNISDVEYQIGDMILSTLLYNEKYKNKNILFIEPFDINEVPDYLDRIGTPIDLRTIANRFYHTNLPDTVPYYYKTIDDFWSDIYKVYNNAIKYHANQTASKWIAKFAKDMIKIVNRERKHIELSLLNNGSNDNVTSTADNVMSSTDGGSNNDIQKPKTKLKLQLPKSGGSSSSTGISHVGTTSSPMEESPTKKPKFQLKLKLTKTGSSTTATGGGSGSNDSILVSSTTKNTSNDITSDGTTTTSKPKLKLKLSLSNVGNKTSTKETSNNIDDQEEGEVVDNVQSTSSVTTQKIKISTPRGKELPQGVVMSGTSSTSHDNNMNTSSTNINAAGNVKKSSSSNTKKSKKLPMSTTASSLSSSTLNINNNLSNTDKASNEGGGGLDAFQLQQCYKVLHGLKRRKSKEVYWFLTPVTDKNILLDYKSKIKYPMDLQTVQQKLDKCMYKKLDAFVLDMRRIFANALRYNTSIKDSLRPLAVDGLVCTEQLLLMFISRHFNNNNNSSANLNSSNHSTSGLPYTPLLYCWNVCINILDTLYNLVNPVDGQPMAYYFLHPVSVYCGGKFPPDYLDVVKKPMDFGTITANLIEGRYQSIESFSSDCRLVVQNCQTYYQGKDESRVFLEQAMRLNECLSTQLSQLARYDKSMKGESERRKLQQIFSNPSRIVQEMILPNQIPAALLLNIIEEMRNLRYTDKGTKITEPAMTLFEKPVSLSDYPDYLQYVSEPIDLQMIERKVKSNDYETPEDFEYDVITMLKNCELYNQKRNAQHPVAISKFVQRKFRTIFYTKIQAYEDPASVAASADFVQPQIVPSSQTTLEEDKVVSGASPNKKIKIDLTASLSKGKTAPRSNVPQTGGGGLSARAKSPATVPPSTTTAATAPALQQRQAVSIKPKLDAPVPLHIAIAKVKEAFPLRRAVKGLQTWEADCARYHKELMRHPWVSAARPKFVFSCPVPILFPELSDHYAAKIRRPMDLTTVECTLLAGNRYTGPEDFIEDIALVFANAIRFNKDGKDMGDPLSCAYYDASVHLLKYSRWLSLDLLSSYIKDSDEKDEPTPDGLPPVSWKLVSGNRHLARQEMEDLVLNEPIEKSLEGDRYTWMEAECEKLLKSLRHQSDLRYMSFFIQPNYPMDYTTVISKPMDWERVQRTLKKRHYDTIGALISDLRLIFTNAEKYNSRLKGIDTVSGLAYEAAKIMSNKLEVAINKMLLSVSDRLERERIDHANAEREIEAAERAEEAEIRAAWNKEEQELEKNGATPGALSQSSSSTIPQSSAASSSVRSGVIPRTRIQRRVQQRRESTDFEIPFFDEDDTPDRYRSSTSRTVGDHEAIKVQKSIFEKQRQELKKMRTVTTSIAATIFRKQLERQIIDREEFYHHKQLSEQVTAIDGSNAMDIDVNNDDNKQEPSSVLETLEKEGRDPVQIKFLLPIKKKKKRARTALANGFDD